jgi:hypothetical protein
LHLVAAPPGRRPFSPEMIRGIISNPVEIEIHVPAHIYLPFVGFTHPT